MALGVHVGRKIHVFANTKVIKICRILTYTKTNEEKTCFAMLLVAEYERHRRSISYIGIGYCTAAIESSTTSDSHASNRDTVVQAQRAFFTVAISLGRPVECMR